jgi:quercetin dioxygenase-like cupin family protein
MKTAWILSCLMSATLLAQQPKFTPLMSKDLANIPGKEGLMLTVEYPPGGADPVHRHNAYGFLYVLEGTVIMQVRGGKATTLTPGQTFYEGPNDVHTVGRNTRIMFGAPRTVLLQVRQRQLHRQSTVTSGLVRGQGYFVSMVFDSYLGFHRTERPFHLSASPISLAAKMGASGSEPLPVLRAGRAVVSLPTH